MHLTVAAAAPMACRLGLVLSLVAVGCTSSDGRPPMRVEALHGVVFARTPELAAEVAAELDASWDSLQRLLPGCRDVPVEVWVQDVLVRPAPNMVLAHAEAYSMPGRGRIVLRETSEGRRDSLVHELVHVLRDASWDPLPKFIHEGLAQLIAQEVVPNERGRMAHVLYLVHRLKGTAVRVVQLASDGSGSDESTMHFEFEGPLLDAVALEGVITETRDPSTMTSFMDKSCGYAIGFLLVQRIVERRGFDGLHALSEGARARGAVSAHELLAAAELSADPEEWWPEIAPGLGDAEARSYAVLMADWLARSIRLVLPQDAEALVMSGRLELRLTDAARVRLADVPKFVDVLRRVGSSPAPGQDASMPGSTPAGPR